jgi:hypothetical protein
MILSFRPLQDGSAVVVRGAHFRICADGTLRGPDNTIAARYLDRLWHLGQRRHISFDCAGLVYLRVTNQRGQRECIGPYASIKAADGAIFSQDNCLGAHAVRAEFGSETVERWWEVSFLTSM